MQLERLTIQRRQLPALPAWADGKSFTVPKGLFKGGQPPAEKCRELAEQLKFLAIYTDAKPTSSRLPINYQRIPPSIRKLVATAVGRFQRSRKDRWAAFPNFPLDLTVDLLTDAGEEMTSISRKRHPVILSHDLDSPEGVDNFVDMFMDMEALYGATSTNYVVPCGWPVDLDKLDKIATAGHKLGIHGYDHSNTTPFLPAEERQKRLRQALPLIRRYGMKGYRAPSLLRTEELLGDLRDYYAYDSSVPTSGGLFPVPNNGCASARPFEIDGLWELPLSLPRDGSLQFMGYRPEQICKVWIECTEQIAASGGVAVLLTHCEKRFSGNPAMLLAYEQFLAHVNDSDHLFFSSPEQVLGLDESHH